MVIPAGSPIRPPSLLALYSACSGWHLVPSSWCGISTVGVPGLALRSPLSMMMMRSIPTRLRPSPSLGRTSMAHGCLRYPLGCLALSALAANVTQTAHDTTSSQTKTAALTGSLYVAEDPGGAQVRAKLAHEVAPTGGRTLSPHRSAISGAVRAGHRILENRRLLSIGRSVAETHSRPRLRSWRPDWSATSSQNGQALRTSTQIPS